MDLQPKGPRPFSAKVGESSPRPQGGQHLSGSTERQPRPPWHILGRAWALSSGTRGGDGTEATQGYVPKGKTPETKHTSAGSRSWPRASRAQKTRGNLSQVPDHKDAPLSSCTHLVVSPGIFRCKLQLELIFVDDARQWSRFFFFFLKKPQKTKQKPLPRRRRSRRLRRVFSPGLGRSSRWLLLTEAGSRPTCLLLSKGRSIEMQVSLPAGHLLLPTGS